MRYNRHTGDAAHDRFAIIALGTLGRQDEQGRIAPAWTHQEITGAVITLDRGPYGWVADMAWYDGMGDGGDIAEHLGSYFADRTVLGFGPVVSLISLWALRVERPVPDMVQAYCKAPGRRHSGIDLAEALPFCQGRDGMSLAQVAAYLGIDHEPVGPMTADSAMMVQRTIRKAVLTAQLAMTWLAGIEGDPRIRYQPIVALANMLREEESVDALIPPSVVDAHTASWISDMVAVHVNRLQVRESQMLSLVAKCGNRDWRAEICLPADLTAEVEARRRALGLPPPAWPQPGNVTSLFEETIDIDDDDRPF